MATESIFLSTLLLGFGVALLLAGLFGAYYGKGRSRGMGFVWATLAVLLIGLFCALTWPVVPGLQPVFDPATVANSLKAVLGAMLGTLAAVWLFVAIAIRS